MFDQMPEPDNVVYNVMFKGYTQNGMHHEVISLFVKMMECHVKLSCYTFPMILKSCGKVKRLCEGEQVHAIVTKTGFKTNPFVGNTLIEMYSCSGAVGRAYKVFAEMSLRNVVSWTSMINGFILCGDVNSAREVFDVAVESDVVLWNTMIRGYIGVGDMENARMLFGTMPCKDTMSWNTILDGYASNGNVETCEELFEVMPKRNVFSWNGLIGVYGKQGCFTKVLTAFNRMLSEGEVLPNHETLATALSACARLGALDLGMWLHVYAQRIGYKGHVSVANALMDMYAKCGRIEFAKDVFNGLVKRDLVSWNTIIGGLAMHGHSSDALAFFDRMKNAGILPDGVTFVGVLCACTHIGSIDEGLSYFRSMSDYSISPQIEHYGCLVDLYARSGHLAEALDLVKMMPMKADSVIWSCLLGASRIYKNMEIAELALERLVELEPWNPANYLTSANIHGDAGKWDHVSKLKVAMRDSRFEKVPGYSMIEIHDKVADFYSSDQRHPETVEIYICLRSLSKLLQLLESQSEDMAFDQEG